MTLTNKSRTPGHDGLLFQSQVIQRLKWGGEFKVNLIDTANPSGKREKRKGGRGDEGEGKAGLGEKHQCLSWEHLFYR